MMKRMTGVMLILGWFLGLPLAAAEEPIQVYNRVQLQAERGREVDNDLMSVVLSAEEESRDAVELAARINAVMASALQQARRVNTVQVHSGSYRIHPLYDADRSLKRWRGSQALQLSGTDVAALSRLVGDLQQQLKVKSMAFSVTPDRRRALQAELTDEALDAFTMRAKRVATRLGFSDYRIVSLHINEQGDPGRPMVMREMAVSASPAPIAVEAGESRVKVTVAGSIELIK